MIGILSLKHMKEFGEEAMVQRLVSRGRPGWRTAEWV